MNNPNPTENYEEIAIDTANESINLRLMDFSNALKGLKNNLPICIEFNERTHEYSETEIAPFTVNLTDGGRIEIGLVKLTGTFSSESIYLRYVGENAQGEMETFLPFTIEEVPLGKLEVKKILTQRIEKEEDKRFDPNSFRKEQTQVTLYAAKVLSRIAFLKQEDIDSTMRDEKIENFLQDWFNPTPGKYYLPKEGKPYSERLNKEIASAQKESISKRIRNFSEAVEHIAGSLPTTILYDVDNKEYLPQESSPLRIPLKNGFIDLGYSEKAGYRNEKTQTIYWQLTTPTTKGEYKSFEPVAFDHLSRGEFFVNKPFVAINEALTSKELEIATDYYFRQQALEIRRLLAILDPSDVDMEAVDLNNFAVCAFLNKWGYSYNKQNKELGILTEKYQIENNIAGQIFIDLATFNFPGIVEKILTVNGKDNIYELGFESEQRFIESFMNFMITSTNYPYFEGIENVLRMEISEIEEAKFFFELLSPLGLVQKNRKDQYALHPFFTISFPDPEDYDENYL